MFNNKIFYLAIFVGVFFLGFWFFNKNEVTNYPSNGKDIIAFGDSLVVGVGASDPSQGFVSKLSKEVGRPIINLGVSGNTTRDGLERLSQLDKHNPKVVLLLLGGNDYLRKIPEEETFSNLEKIIQDIHSRGAVVVLLGVRGGLLSDKFESDFERISGKHQTAYVPNVLDGLITNQRYMADAVHPNDWGYQMIADKVYPVLEKVLN